VESLGHLGADGFGQRGGLRGARLEVDVDATSISGRLSSTMPLDERRGLAQDAVSISAKTVSAT